LALTTTTWLDENDKEQHGTFNPDGNSPKERFGATLGEIKGYPPRNYVSAHASGDNVHLRDAAGTVFLGPQILDATANADQREDELAASIVEGAAAALLKLGREKGIIPMVAEPTTVKPTEAVKAQAVTSWPDLTELVKFIASEVASIRQNLESGVPKKGGGVPALKARTAIGRLILLGGTIATEWPGVDH
jgi:hypothetical protein